VVQRVARHLLAAAQLARANVERLPTPIKVNLCVTYWCQYRCQTCNIWRRRPADELTTGELRQLIDLNRDARWLDVTGGEIFLRNDLPELFDAIAATWRKLAVFHFATNGFLTDRIVALTDRLARATAARVIVTVSLDGDERVNDEIRGIRGGYRRQIDTFNALRRLPGVETVFGMTLSRRNVDLIDETFAACRRDCPGLRIEDFHVNVAQRSSHYYDNAGSDAVDVPSSQLRAALGQYRRLRGPSRSVSAWVESRYLRHLDAFLATGASPMQCHALRSSCFIDPWGTVYPCISYARPIGHLRDTGMRLAPIWDDGGTRQMQCEIWHGHCPHCWTACEAYQSILGNLIRPWATPPPSDWPGRRTPVPQGERP